MFRGFSFTDDSITSTDVIAVRVNPAVHYDEIGDETRYLTLEKAVIPANHCLFVNVYFVVVDDDCEEKVFANVIGQKLRQPNVEEATTNLTLT